MAPAFFSIIIPAYNSALTIENTLRSIEEQSMADYEIVIMDGGSKDDTLQIIKRCVPDKSKLILVSEKDNGIYDAMNKGIKNSQGELLYFLGSDDVLADSTVLTEIKKTLIAEPADVIYGDIIRKSDKGKFGGEFDIMRLLTRHNMCHQAVFYKRSVFEKLGNYNTNYKVWADWEFNIRCFRHTELKLKYINKEIAVYNNVTGLSSVQEDPLFKKELPKFYMQELDEIKWSKAYRIGNRIMRLLNFGKNK